MTLSQNFRILIGVLIVCEAYILLDSAEQRHHFQGIILVINQFFKIKLVSYHNTQIVRFIMIALMYTAGTSIIFDVGSTYTSKYFLIKCFLEAIALLQGVSHLRSCLVICIHLAFYFIFLRIKKEEVDNLLAKSQEKILEPQQINQVSQAQNSQIQ